MKRICLVCDMPNWALDIIARKLQKELKDHFAIDIAYFDASKNPEMFFEFWEEHKNYDLVHFFWRKIVLQIENEAFVNKVKEQYGDYEKYVSEMSNKITTSIHDFLFLLPEEIERYKNVINSYSKQYFVICKPLLKIYNGISEYKKPWGIVHDAIDTDIMIPSNLERFDNYDRPLIIGWIGNSKFHYGVDLKGFNTIINPTIEELKSEGYNICENYADRNIIWRTHAEMPEYYNSIDVSICASLSEGTPLPIVESMCCGVPVITTDVGVVREALGSKQQEYIIGNRDGGSNDENVKNMLKEKLKKLYKNRNILKELSEENLESIKKYDGGKIIEEYGKFFESALSC